MIRWSAENKQILYCSFVSVLFHLYGQLYKKIRKQFNHLINHQATALPYYILVFSASLAVTCTKHAPIHPQ